MKYTLLELVQSVLGSIDGDEVNSYSETTESLQVANIIRDTYFGIVSKLDAPEHFTFFELEASSSSSPTLMTLPTFVASFSELKYNNVELPDTSPIMKTVTALPVNIFMDKMHQLNTDDDNVGSYQFTTDNANTIDILYMNDKFPEFYTTFDDYNIIFDSYNSVEDTYLVKNKSLGYGQIIPTWTFNDSFTPDLDSRQFQILLNEAKELAAAELKQSSHSIAARNARRAWINAQRTKQAVKIPTFWDSLPNYGRKHP